MMTAVYKYVVFLVRCTRKPSTNHKYITIHFVNVKGYSCLEREWRNQ